MNPSSFESKALWLLLCFAILVSVVESSQDNTAVSHIAVRKAHISIGSIKGGSLLPDEANYIETSLMSAVKSSEADDGAFQMLYAGVFKNKHPIQIQTTNKNHAKTADQMEGEPRLRGLASGRTSYRGLSRYDYSLFFKVRCNCGTFWDRRLLSATAPVLSDTSQVADNLCSILRSGPFEVFRKVEGCIVELF